MEDDKRTFLCSVSVSASTISFLTTVIDEDEGDNDKDEEDLGGVSSSV